MLSGIAYLSIVSFQLIAMSTAIASCVFVARAEVPEDNDFLLSWLGSGIAGCATPFGRMAEFCQQHYSRDKPARAEIAQNWAPRTIKAHRWHLDNRSPYGHAQRNLERPSPSKPGQAFI
ncbi:hypothetical protein BD626DRAFT_537663 [Schizophyllum amplum]|uniref:Uncharacterized protein n=1 Tax=Schizophyllum amplum TaxID=97359 RepID=A0A550CC26_9AGAR|nr:hypothetical protein BD626DRAFT_537663 [Auriculariopsis ampla]